jgi:hypothetical protein
MLIVLFLASRRPTVIFAPAAVPSVAPAGDASGTAEAPLPTADAGPPPEVKVVRVSEFPGTADPFAAAWEKSPAVELPLQPQQTAPPFLTTATISAIRVQAIRDDNRIGWRLSWADDSPSSIVEVSQFADAVAMQFPQVDNAPFTMGGKGQPVRLLFWKALWQKDVDEGFQDTKALYANAWNDLSWNDLFRGIADLPAQFKDEQLAQQWLIGLSAGNPMSGQQRTQPVEELYAEGFGSSTHVESSTCTGRGVWKDGRWTVVVDRALDPADPLTSRWLNPNVQQQISLAVWDGSAENTGARKHWCPWMPMKIEP